MKITWRDDLSIGIPSIDDQHKELFQRFNSLISACADGKGRDKIAELMKFLRDYTEVHFFDEEAFQDEISYPERHAHRHEHKEFVRRLSELEAEFGHGGASLPLVIKTNNFLMEWLVRHISRSDRAMADFISRGKNIQPDAHIETGGNHARD